MVCIWIFFKNFLTLSLSFFLSFSVTLVVFFLKYCLIQWKCVWLHACVRFYVYVCVCVCVCSHSPRPGNFHIICSLKSGPRAACAGTRQCCDASAVWNTFARNVYEQYLQNILHRTTAVPPCRRLCGWMLCNAIGGAHANVSMRPRVPRRFIELS